MLAWSGMLGGAIAAAGCDVAFGLDGAPGTTFVLDSAAGTTDLVDVPVLIALDPSMIAYGTIDDPATDLRFVDPRTGEELAYEVSHWDEDGESHVWVRVPRLTAGASADEIALTWGPDVGTGGTIPREVWRGHELVLHLEQLDAVPDAAGHFVGTAAGVTAAPGVVGAGVGLAAGGVLAVPDQRSLLDGWPTFTLELWLHPEAALVTAATPGATLLTAQGPVATFRIEPVGDHLELRAAFAFADSGVQVVSAEVPSGAWSHLAVVADGAQLRIYRDGSEVAAVAATGALAPSTSYPEGLELGGEPFEGVLDEVRISAVARSPDWLRAQVLSMTRALVQVR